MAEIEPQYLDSGVNYPAKQDRQPFRDILTEGILTSGALAVTQSGTPAMSVSVTAGVAYVQNDEATDRGHYRIYNDAAVTKTIAAADPSNPRIDRVIAQVRDATDISGADNDWQIQVLTGTPAASPSAPALPNNAISLATVAVAAGATTIVNANITDTRTVLSIKTNKIAEQDSGSGVTIDGILLKDDLDTSGIVGKTTAQIITNKRITRRVYSTTSLSTLTPEISTYDEFALTAQAAALTIANHSTSTPVDGDKMLITITPDATPRALSFGTAYVAKAGIALPTTTTASKTMIMGFRWDAGLSKWNLIALGTEA